VVHGARLMGQIAADPAPARAFAIQRALDINRRFAPATIADEFLAAIARHRTARV